MRVCVDTHAWRGLLHTVPRQEASVGSVLPSLGCAARDEDWEKDTCPKGACVYESPSGGARGLGPTMSGASEKEHLTQVLETR